VICLAAIPNEDSVNSQPDAAGYGALTGDPNWATVVAAWPKLPDAIRNAIGA
jgi:hypothetical protein